MKNLTEWQIGIEERFRATELEVARLRLKIDETRCARQTLERIASGRFTADDAELVQAIVVCALQNSVGARRYVPVADDDGEG